MKKQSIIITFFSSVLAGTLIFLGIFFALKPEKEKDGSIPDQKLEEEFKEIKKKIFEFDIDKFKESDYVFSLFNKNLNLDEKTSYKKRYDKLKENYQYVEHQFNQYEEVDQNKKEFFKELNKNATGLIELLGNFTNDYDKEYQNYLEGLTGSLFSKIEESKTDFFSPQEKIDFNQNITDIKKNLTNIFNRDKYNLTDEAEKDYQKECQSEIDYLADLFRNQEEEFQKNFTAIKDNCTTITNQINDNYREIEEFDLTSFTKEDQDEFKDLIEKIKEKNEQIKKDKDNCDSKETRFEQKECLTEKIPNYQDLNEEVIGLKNKIKDGTELINCQKKFETEFNIIKGNFTNLNQTYFDSSESEKAKIFFEMTKKAIEEIEDISCNQKDLMCWQDKISKIETLKNYLSDETINEFINNIENIKNNNSVNNTTISDLINSIITEPIGSFFENTKITKKFQNEFDFYIKDSNESKIFETFKYQSWEPSDYRSLKGTQLFINDNYNRLHLINEIGEFIKFRKDLNKYVDSTLEEGKPFISYLNWFQACGIIVFDVIKFGLNYFNLYASSSWKYKALYLIFLVGVNIFYNLSENVDNKNQYLANTYYFDKSDFISIDDIYDIDGGVFEGKYKEIKEIYKYANSYIKYIKLNLDGIVCFAYNHFFLYFYKLFDLSRNSEYQKLFSTILSTITRKFVFNSLFLFKKIGTNLPSNVFDLEKSEEKLIPNGFFSIQIKQIILPLVIFFVSLKKISKGKLAITGATVGIAGISFAGIKFFSYLGELFKGSLNKPDLSPDGRPIPYLLSYSFGKENIYVPINTEVDDDEISTDDEESNIKKAKLVEVDNALVNNLETKIDELKEIKDEVINNKYKVEKLMEKIVSYKGKYKIYKKQKFNLLLKNDDDNNIIFEYLNKLKELIKFINLVEKRYDVKKLKKGLVSLIKEVINGIIDVKKLSDVKELFKKIIKKDKNDYQNYQNYYSIFKEMKELSEIIKNEPEEEIIEEPKDEQPEEEIIEKPKEKIIEEPKKEGKQTLKEKLDKVENNLKSALIEISLSDFNKGKKGTEKINDALENKDYKKYYELYDRYQKIKKTIEDLNLSEDEKAKLFQKLGDPKINVLRRIVIRIKSRCSKEKEEEVDEVDKNNDEEVKLVRSRKKKKNKKRSSIAVIGIEENIIKMDEEAKKNEEYKEIISKKIDEEMDIVKVGEYICKIKSLKENNFLNNEEDETLSSKLTEARNRIVLLYKVIINDAVKKANQKKEKEEVEFDENDDENNNDEEKQKKLEEEKNELNNKNNNNKEKKEIINKPAVDKLEEVKLEELNLIQKTFLKIELVNIITAARLDDGVNFDSFKKILDYAIQKGYEEDDFDLEKFIANISTIKDLETMKNEIINDKDFVFYNQDALISKIMENKIKKAGQEDFKSIGNEIQNLKNLIPDHVEQLNKLLGEKMEGIIPQ